MEKESQRLLESVMKLIAAQFGPDCEVVLHDWSKEYESTIVAIENGHVSGRKVGDGGSNLGLEVMRGTTDGSNQLNYITQTQDGRMLRSSSLYLTDENGKKVGALFLTGFGPGILMAIFMLIYAYIYVKKNPNIKMNGQKVTAKEAATVFLQSIWALVMPVIILGGIYSGIFTPTESGAIASVYGLICGRYIYKTLEWKNLPKILVNTAVGAGTIMLILGSVQTFSVVLTRGHIPQILSEALLSVTTNKYILLLMFNILLLIAGMFLNAVSAIALFTPILLPIMTSVGVNPYLMGIVMIVNLGIGMITPPVGNCLYVACGMSKRLSFEQISKACIPYIVMLMIALLLITYVEPISMGLIWLTGASAI